MFSLRKWERIWRSRKRERINRKAFNVSPESTPNPFSLISNRCVCTLKGWIEKIFCKFWRWKFKSKILKSFQEAFKKLENFPKFSPNSNLNATHNKFSSLNNVPFVPHPTPLSITSSLSLLHTKICPRERKEEKNFRFSLWKFNMAFGLVENVVQFSSFFSGFEKCH